MNRVAGAINHLLGKCGYRIERISPDSGESPYSDLFPGWNVPDVNRLLAAGERIPGMVGPESAKFLFSLCYMQRLEGDVVEIGSWQGYSTSFLAHAVRESGNGRMFAIDHFGGNAGKRELYMAEREDLADLPEVFRRNMRGAGVSDVVNLLEMSNEVAVSELKTRDVKIRFLLIDGDHTREGVQRDIDLFFPLLAAGAIVVFDDCSTSAPGVVGAVQELFSKGTCHGAFTYTNTVVVLV